MNLPLFTLLGVATVAGCATDKHLPDRNPARGAATAARLAQLSERANTELTRGNVRAYPALIAHAPDFTLMAPPGGKPTRGFDASEERLASMAKFFRGGSAFDQELVASYAVDDMVVLVTVERLRAQIASLPEQDWSLRVTQVYRNDGGTWRLVHRHADPLAGGISLQEMAELGRREQERGAAP